MNLIISIFIGALTSVMILFNGTLSDTFGNFTASIIIHIVGLLSIILVLIISRSKFRMQKGIPFYLYSAGAVGVFTVLFTNISFNTLGASLTVALGLSGQSIISILIDHFGLFRLKTVRFNRKKYIGLLLIAVGIIIMTIY